MKLYINCYLLNFTTWKSLLRMGTKHKIVSCRTKWNEKNLDEQENMIAYYGNSTQMENKENYILYF